MNIENNLNVDLIEQCGVTVNIAAYKIISTRIENIIKNVYSDAASGFMIIESHIK